MVKQLERYYGKKPNNALHRMFRGVTIFADAKNRATPEHR
jgi:hypothetical protein